MNRFKQLEDSIFIGPQPTDQDLKQARQLGIRTVIDFRLPNETEARNETLAADNGLNYVNIPVNKTDLSQEQINELDRVMREKAGPFLIHCASGARAAMLLSLSKAKRHGWTAQRTFEEARAMGFDLQNSPEFSAFVTAVTSDEAR
ncbi:beta-lactamase hydrolase domain-containing protein [Noviherbaspirillum sp.]|uniref:beta-lactamase hydrolase domain-containing protein n=1 Tax=Noviherbaspirillum sp. TaxID=1926288 RepID=UPI002B49F4C1|nr:sulfur transferase domain-containing protein [Noviherbaspirillum sp.]HJV81730.1 sulfur transferase domain-containing protein [Noviherbaspirillum sp.]